jgi:hypothetical protein
MGCEGRSQSTSRLRKLEPIESLSTTGFSPETGYGFKPGFGQTGYDIGRFRAYVSIWLRLTTVVLVFWAHDVKCTDREKLISYYF